MSTPSGWYDDPQDSTQLRYWDGVTWTDHRTPKAPPAPAAAPPAPAAPAAPTPTPATPTYGAPGAGTSDPWTSAPSTSAPAYPSMPQMSQLPAANAPWALGVPATPDGVPLAGLGSRLGARIVDWIILGIVTGFAASGPISKIVSYYGALIDDVARQVDQGLEPTTPTTTEILSAIGGPLAQLTIMAVVIGVLYESIFLLTMSATPGKKLLGIGVRLRERPGKLNILTVLARQVIWVAGSLPVLSFVAGPANLLDALWPLWDRNKQALHDKLAKTQVVRTR